MRIFSRIFMALIVRRFFYKVLVRNKGIRIMQDDWDNLVILDACRYDMFEKLNDIEGKLEHRVSRGSSTTEFMSRNFQGGVFNDTVYITANPLVNYNVPKSFLRIVPVWKYGWDEELGTVLPETTLKYALETNQMYPHKRLIIHFTQPHYPFIGQRSRKRIGPHDGMSSRAVLLGLEEAKAKKRDVWSLLKEGEIDKDTLWKCYEENLRIALECAKKLIKKLVGKTVITSDHGNLFGERLFPFFWIKGYGHPRFVYHSNLIKVPWLVVEKGERKEINTHNKYQDQDFSDDLEQINIKSKLEALGYFD